MNAEDLIRLIFNRLPHAELRRDIDDGRYWLFISEGGTWLTPQAGRLLETILKAA